MGRFESNWSNRPESQYLHWTRGVVRNQIQLAFRNHWEYLCHFHGATSPGKSLEVGAGRGSLSAYFADGGWDSTLLDLSPTAVSSARDAFAASGLNATFVEADCLDMPFEANTFDLIFSIGLLEHFEDTRAVLAEKYRVLKPGGRLLSYVVPEHTPNVQLESQWVNALLTSEAIYVETDRKTAIYRNSLLHSHYEAELLDLGLEHVGHDWVYGLPMISTSPSFPFTLLPDRMELVLVDEFSKRLGNGPRKWICEDFGGQAFFVFGTKV